MEYVDAEKLRAEIERQKKHLSESSLDERGSIIAYDTVLRFIHTLQQEQPEVDFETEYAKFSNDTDALDYAFPIDLADYKDFARHFYELGLNAKSNSYV